MIFQVKLFSINSIIEQVSEIKFLGLWIDDRLKWRTHTQNLCKTLSKNAGLIHKLKSFVPKPILTLLYSAIISPYINYGIMAWGKAPAKQITSVLMLQKRAIRSISFEHRLAHCDPLFFDHGILKIGDLFDFNIGVFMFNLKKGKIPVSLAQQFKLNSQIHSYSTRQSSAFRLPRNNTTLRQNTIFYYGPKLWLSLPAQITTSNSSSTFKMLYKEQLINQYKP